MLQEQDEKLKIADREVREAVENSKKAGEEIQQASGHKFKTLKYKIGMFFGGVGAVVGGILGLGVGAAAGGAGGIIVGTTVGSKIDKLAKKKYGNVEFEGAQ